MSSSSLSISTEIQSIFEKNKLEDLKQFIKKRNCLNSYSMFLVYFFHIIQSAGILTTTIAAGYDNKTIIWVGVGLNLLASLINIFEKTNNAISKNILKDIQAIKEGTFIDEGITIEMPSDKNDKNDKPLLS